MRCLDVEQPAVQECEKGEAAIADARRLHPDRQVADVHHEVTTSSSVVAQVSTLPRTSLQKWSAGGA